MKIRIAKYVYVHIQPQALGPQWGQQENEEMTDRHRTHTKSRVLCIGISDGPTAPRYSTHLLCRVEQRGEVSMYNWTRRSSCYIQISKEAGLIVHNLIKGRDLTTHYRCSLCGDQASSPKHLGTESDGDIFCTQSTLILCLPRSFASSYEVLDMTFPCKQYASSHAFIHSRLFLFTSQAIAFQVCMHTCILSNRVG